MKQIHQILYKKSLCENDSEQTANVTKRSISSYSK